MRADPSAGVLACRSACLLTCPPVCWHVSLFVCCRNSEQDAQFERVCVRLSHAHAHLRHAHAYMLALKRDKPSMVCSVCIAMLHRVAAVIDSFTHLEPVTL